MKPVPAGYDKYHRLQVSILVVSGKYYPIYEGVNTIGRNKEAVVNIKNLNISQNHAILIVTDNKHFISDLNSSNGTFVNGAKVTPFKLHQLSDKSCIKFGILTGVYHLSTEASELNQSKNIEFTQDITQTFYNAETQIFQDITNLETTQNLIPTDIHDAPTQQAYLPDFILPPQSEALSDIDEHSPRPSTSKEAQKTAEGGTNNEVQSASNKTDDESTQELSSDTIRNISKLVTSINGEEAEKEICSRQKSSDKCTKRVHFMEEREEFLIDIHAAETQPFDYNKPVHFREEEKEESLNDIQVAETQPFDLLHLSEAPHNEINEMQVNEAESPNTNVDEDDTDCEDNLEKLQEKESENNLKENDSSNDSVDFFKLEVSVGESPKLASTNKPDLNGDNSDDNTDVEQEVKETTENLSPIIKNTQDNVNDIEDVSKEKTAAPSFESDSETDDECFIRQKKKKPVRIIYTQDSEENKANSDSDSEIHYIKKKPVRILSSQEETATNLIVEDSYIGSESEIETSKITATNQNVSVVSFSDSYLIPATQDQLPPLSVNNKKKDNINEFSEESFKLGITQLMEGSENTQGSKSQESHNQSKDKIGELESDLSLAPTQAMQTKEVTQEVNDKSEDTDLYYAPTQKIFESNAIELEGELDETANPDMYTAITQKITSDVQGSCNDGDSDVSMQDIYLQPTQAISTEAEKLCTDKHNKEPDIDLQPNQNQNETIDRDLYAAATQKICIDKHIQDDFSSDVIDFSASTEKVSMDQHNQEADAGIDLQPNRDVVVNVSELINPDIYAAATQKIPIDEQELYKDDLSNNAIDFSAATQKVCTVQHNKELEDTADIYTASTQKMSICKHIAKSDNDLSKDGCSQQIEQLYRNEAIDLSAATQRVPLEEAKKGITFQVESKNDTEDIYMQATQKVDNFKFLDSKEDSSKRKFSFKNKPCNLDDSLTTILKGGISAAVEEKSIKKGPNVEVTFAMTETVSDNADGLVNPLSHFLEKNAEIKATDNQTALTSNDTDTTEGHIDRREDQHLTHNAKGLTSQIDFRKSENEEKTIEKTNSPKDDDTKITNKKNKLLGVPEKVKRTPRKRKGSTEKDTNVKEIIPKPTRRSKRIGSQELQDINDNINEQIEELPSIKKIVSSGTIRKGKGLRKASTRRRLSTDSNKSKVSEKSELSDGDEVMEPPKVTLKPSKRPRRLRSDNDMTKLDESDTELERAASKSGIMDQNESRLDSTKNISMETTMNHTLLASKKCTTRKTRKTTDVEELQIKVSKDRRSMALIEKPEISDAKVTKPRAPRSKKTAKITEELPSTSKQDVDQTAVCKTQKTIKRKTTEEASSSNLSDSSDFSGNSNLSTPKRQKLQPHMSLLNSTERNLRRLKPKVVFTMMDNPQMECMIRHLGGSIVHTVESCTVLVTEHVKRSQKLLSAVGEGKPICSPKWITDSKKACEFLDPWDYILIDKEAESKWDFSLKESLNRSHTNRLLQNCNFQIMVSNAADVLKGAIESCGGKCVSRITKNLSDNTFLISSPENQSKYRKMLKQNPQLKVIESEAIFDGVLRQELRFSEHYLT